MTISPQEGYDGPARLVRDESVVDVTVSLRGVFSPIDGRYHWYGRVDRCAAVDDLAARGTDVLLCTAAGEARARLSDVDPWGRYRVTGAGRPPFGRDLADGDRLPL